MLAGVLAIVGALAAGYYFAMRPVTLRIAVGPANSDDLKVMLLMNGGTAGSPPTSLSTSFSAWTMSDPL